MLRLLICDDAPDAREAVRSSLADQDEIEVVAEAENGEEAIALAASHEPNVVLMDVKMPLVDGIAATRRIRDLPPKTRIVAYAGSDDADDVMAMMEAGADAYCLKGAPLWELERAIAGASNPLVRLAHAISRSMNAGGTAEFVARELAELTGASFAATYLATADTSLSLAALSGPGAPESLHSAPGVVARAFDELALAHATTHELGELYRLGAACGEAIAAPLVADGQPLGAVLVALPASIQAESDPELVSAVADLASVALANERRLALTYVEARRDALTGLANKRAFDEHLDKLLGPGRTQPVALVLFDLDGFKQVNDQHGHVVGDDVLREVGRVFMRVVRAEDEIFRVGGEEFALVVEGSAREAGQIAERMRFGLAQSRRGHRLPTASAGVAAVPEHAHNADELQRKADIALYAAKLSGKNRVQIYAGDREETRPVERTPHLRPVADPERGERGLRLLVVDDDPSLRILLRTTFEVVDIEVEEADSADFARERIAAHVPDVVVLDVSMPGTDGLTFCRQLKADPATEHIGVVLLTGSEGGTETAVRRGRVPAQAVQPARAAEPRRAHRRRPVRGPLPRSRGPARGAADPLRAGSPAPARGRARPARDHPARLPRDRDRARRSARDEGHRHRRALAARAALRDGARNRPRSGAARGRERGVRLPAPRHRQDRDPGQHPPEARRALADRAPPAPEPHGPRRATAERGRAAPGPGARGRAPPSRALGRLRLPGRARRDRDPTPRTRLRRGRRARRDDQRPAVPRRAELGGGRGGDPP